MARDKNTLLRDFHEARWDEPFIFEMSVPGERGVLVPRPCEEVASQAGDVIGELPEFIKRKTQPQLPEVGQMRVNRHYMRLSQETLGADVNIDISQGTCTMKYSPKVQEHLAARNPNVTEIHPLQDPSTMQGILEVYYRTEQFLKEISGLDSFSFQSGGGAHAVLANAYIVRAYHADRGDDKRDEIITTIFSHPCDAGSPATAGYKVITLMPDENGYANLDAMKSSLSERTAAIFITNPEDTGIYNPRIKEYVDAAHEAGALCVYDQANANAVLGIARAKEAGFDLCHFNLHKTFSAPHGCMGPGVGALGAKGFLQQYLPVPRVEFDGEKYYLDDNCPNSIGRVRSFLGNFPVVLKAYMWIMQMGADGLREAAIISVLNSQYMTKYIRQIPGVVIHYAEGKRRLEQVRYSWEKLKEDTGFGTEDVQRRLVDYGVQHYWMSHHPWIIPEPFTLEPCEAYSKDDMDEYLSILRQISKECYEQPDLIRNCPHNAPIHRLVKTELNDYEEIAVTWRQYLKRNNK
ncbi:MAG: aminomethyl-transferring glycine dehydrogenase subunit GcvPB [Syntrophomonadaceae bacterium]|nr:aminomethyl-transferring glycine dehydrogenase subunit GcvPB [Syntrophomonadaceae bacterium]MDD3889864.1 aminomethyl-transferring glycine dehydrogenase subunit GcvPB [Syntrophomonadaceae bacterium]MDD4549981.1 aminomethyl-transferring glycine dehydrogenase subunit GcvPB [Syntrophomonadaceae bacterium]